MAEKKYEILESLPTYGKMHISITNNNIPYYSEGFAVRFYKEDNTEWVGNFKPGFTDLNGVFELSQSTNILVVAKGACYLMNPEDSKPISIFGSDYTAILKTSTDQYVFQGNCELTIIEPNGDHWYTQQISWDGLSDMSINDNTVTGLSYDPINDSGEWVKYTYDISKKQLIGGSCQRYKETNLPKWKGWLRKYLGIHINK